MKDDRWNEKGGRVGVVEGYSWVMIFDRNDRTSDNLKFG